MEQWHRMKHLKGHIFLSLFHNLSGFLFFLLLQASWRNLLCKTGIALLLAPLVFSWLVEPAHAITYANSSVPFSWIDASTHAKIGYNTTPYKFNGGGGCGSTPPILDDTMGDNISIGFTFMYSGLNFTSVRIMSNGRLQFNNNTTCGYGSPVTQLPYPDAGLNYTMRIYGNDLDPTLQSEVTGYNTVCTNRSTCYVSYATIGTAPYRRFVVTWSNVPEWTNTNTASGSYNLQIILQENGEFVYQYGTDIPGPANINAQIGWQADTNDYDIPAMGFPTSNTAIKFYIPRPVVEYRMEQSTWTAATGQVLDTSGNNRHGMAVTAGASTRPNEVATGKVCRGGQIADNNSTADISAIDTGIAVPATVGGVGTITFWYNNSSNTPNRNRMLFDASTINNRWFYLTRTSNGALSFVVTDSGNTSRTATTANNALPNTGWSHIAVSWNFNNLAAGNSDHLRIYVNGVMSKTSVFTTANAVSPNIGTLYIGDNRSGVSPVAASAGNPGGSDATLDEFRIYNYEGGVALIQRDMNQIGTCLNHYAISHNGAGTTCQITPVTITAHSVAHDLIIMPNNTTQITLSTSTGKGDWSLLNGYGVLDNGTMDDGLASYLFNGEYQAIFGFSHTIDATVNINVTDGQITESATEDPALILYSCAQPSGFNCVESGADPLTGHLYTKMAGTAFSFDVVALKDANSDGNADAVETGYASDVDKNVTVELVNGSGAIPCASRTVVNPAVSQTLTFAQANQPTEQGRKATANMTVAKAYPDLRCRVTDANQSPNIVACSIDNFAVRPGAVTLSTTATATPPSSTATPKIKTGSPFTVTAATSTAAADTYIGALALDINKLTAQITSQDTTQEIGGVVGTLSPAALTANQTPAPSDNASYTEVGYLYLAPGAYRDNIYTLVDQPNDCISSTTGGANLADSLSSGKYGCVIGNKTATAFGRFIPHHFDVSISPNPPVFADNCTSGVAPFTYLGQPFNWAAVPSVTIQARNAANAVTQNYEGAFWKLVEPLLDYTYVDANVGLLTPNANAGPLAPATSSQTLPPTTDCNGTVSVPLDEEPDRFKYTRPTMDDPQLPFVPAVSFTIATAKLTDSDTVCYDLGAGVGCQPFEVSGITGNHLRHGQLVVKNNFGPETADITRSPFEVHYYLVNKWVVNVDDNCTTTAELVFCPTTRVSAIAPSPLLAGGKGTMTVSSPNPVATETLMVCPTAPAWLTALTDCTVPDSSCGKFTFGIYRGNDRIINWQEISK